MTSEQAKPKFACPICEARALLADAISAEVKAAAQIYHLANHWRSAHEVREFSNFQAEDLTRASLDQFDADTIKESEWFAQYHEAIAAHAEAVKVSVQARTNYHERLRVHTDTRVAKD